jgi:hypothetical protein
LLSSRGSISAAATDVAPDRRAECDPYSFGFIFICFSSVLIREFGVFDDNLVGLLWAWKKYSDFSSLTWLYRFIHLIGQQSGVDLAGPIRIDSPIRSWSVFDCVIFTSMTSVWIPLI